MAYISTLYRRKQKNCRDSYQIGAAFEYFTLTRFSKKAFDLKRWRKSSKLQNLYFPYDHFNPDFELELVLSAYEKYRFAVECKYRARFVYGNIEWATKTKIKRYKAFQRQRRMPVFVAIGVGGNPRKPERLFIIPLDEICNDIMVDEGKLSAFERSPWSKVYYKVGQGSLV